MFEAVGTLHSNMPGYNPLRVDFDGTLAFLDFLFTMVATKEVLMELLVTHNG